MSENKEPKPRITSWIRTNFGEGILEEIKAGKRTIELNGKKLDPKDEKFRDKRVLKTSKVEIKPHPDFVMTEKTGEKGEWLSRNTGKSEEPEELEEKYVKDFLSTEEIKCVESGKANVFVDGLAAKLDKEISIDSDSKPTLDGKPVIIKVLPQFAPG